MTGRFHHLLSSALMRLCGCTVLLLLAGGERAQRGHCEHFSTEVSVSSHLVNDHYSYAASSLSSIIRQLHWTNIILISDEPLEALGDTDELLTSIADDFRKFIIFHSSVAWQQQGLPVIVSLGPRGATQSLDIVLVCSLACVTSVLDGAREFENRWRSQTALRERSRWLVHPTDVSSPRWLDLSNVTMNNVAVLVLERPSDPALSPRASLHTLRWTIQGRQLELVAQSEDFPAPASTVFPNLQLGLNGKLLRVGMNPYARFTMQSLEDGTTVYGGIEMDLLLVLSEHLNFTYEIHLPEDKTWGLPSQNGSWNGLIGMLQRREIDTVLILFEYTTTRSTVVDFSVPLDFPTMTFVYRKTIPRSFGLLTYLKPFRLEVIGCIFVVTLLTALVMAALDFISSAGELHMPEKSETTGQSPSSRDQWTSKLRLFLGPLLFTFEALFLIGQEKDDTRTSSGRVVVTCWWLFCVVVAAAYTGNLVAFLAVPRESFPISSLEDLVSQTQYKWGAVGSSAVHLVLKESNLSLHRKLWKGIEKFAREDPDVLNPDDAVHIQKVLREDYIYLIDSSLAEDWLNRHCELAVYRRGLAAGPSAFLFQKNSAYQPLFSRKIETLRESGLWTEMQNRWRMQATNRNCTISASSTEEHSAALVDVQGALYVLLVGVAAAAVVLIIEVLIQLGRTRQKRRKERE